MQVDLALPITMDALSGFGSNPVPVDRGQTANREPRFSGAAIHEETELALAVLSLAVVPFNVSLKFSKDQDTGTIVVQMIDQKSGETLQQIPNEARLQVAACLCKWQGRILNRRA